MAKLEARVLIVEDDFTMADFLEEVVGKLRGRGVRSFDTAHSYKEGARLIEDRAYDLAIVNYFLGDGYGDELVPTIKIKNNDCYVIGTSRTSEFAERFKIVGANGFIAYPATEKMLLEKLQNSLKEMESASKCVKRSR